MWLTCLGSRYEVDERLLGASPAAVRRQVREYERGDRRAFDLDADLPDSFLGSVLAELRAIPYGETRTYGEVADRLDTAAVAVGQGCARNPLPLVVPCHRVVAADGSLRGFSAEGGVAAKRRLLDFEGAQSLAE